MVTSDITKEQLTKLLHQVPDPEIPVLSVIDLGVIRDIIIGKHHDITIVITPTYSGCPAMKMIEEEIISKIKESGFENVTVQTILSPAWTTDWISDEAKEKLREYGIAPPQHNSADKSLLSGKPKIVVCPQCRSPKTEMISQFGSTACKALYRCLECKEPFDYFKCI